MGKLQNWKKLELTWKMQDIFAGIIDCKMRPVQLQMNIELNPKIVLFPDKTLISFGF